MDESKRLALLRHFTYEQDDSKKSKFFHFHLDPISIEPGSFTEKLLQAGLEMPRWLYLSLVFTSGLLVAYLALFLGPILATYSFGLYCYYFLVTYIEERSQKRRKIIVPQIPSFLDGLTTALNTGYSIDAALLQGAQSIPEGILRSELENAINLLNSGMTVDEAFKRLRQRIVGREIISIVTAIDLFSSMGGRMLDPFERLGRKMRDQQHALARAGRDLVQIKQAFIIIGALSVLAPFAVFLMQPTYIMSALNDSFGRLILQCSVMVEITAIFIFKNMINLKV